MIWNKIKNWRSVQNPAPITLRNIFAVLQSFFRRNTTIPTHIHQQVEFRRLKANSECISQGFCKECGCDMEGKLYEDRSCDGYCYPDMMDKQNWKEYKKAFKIK